MKININDNPLKSYPSIPNYWETEEANYVNYSQLTELHFDHGWRDLITPSYDEKTEYLGGIIQGDGDDYTYEVLQKSPEQIEAEALADAQNAQASALSEYMKKQVQEEIQELDDGSALDNQALFPFWDEDEDVEVDDKRQDVNAEGEMVLWKCIQGHTTQANWRPKNTPALWLRIAYEGEYLVWVQPTGAHDAYMEGDIVWYPEKDTDLWISMVDANVYAPGIVQGQWEIYTP